MLYIIVGARAGELTGEYMLPMAAKVLTTASEIAFFSLVCPQVVDTQPSITLFTA